jgi:hypothetical protein
MLVTYAFDYQGRRTSLTRGNSVITFAAVVANERAAAYTNAISGDLIPRESDDRKNK